jgi:hypothetical protein
MFHGYENIREQYIVMVAAQDSETLHCSSQLTRLVAREGFTEVV